MWEEFKEFALKGSVVDMAIGIIIGAAFSKIVNSLVDDIIMPPVGLIVAKINFNNLFISLTGHHYRSLAAAKAAGAPTLNYGEFLTNVLNFLIVAAILFFVVRELNVLRRNSQKTKVVTASKCPYCKEVIQVQATRCPHCTADLTAPKIKLK
ncbi:large conductance mechanosensitive channel protein MscL [Alicyclobacillus sp. SO9]|uniref:large conductance mechanosensitive channel protein MscL n=1 Tax=Alicyclobacillus sp. SO9 TaxID=2665646 RepID=UPI0018E6DEBE|nr:large conductance mechanosensitive channel protein MscL [Alicyclobacillus sp. SO9]QQE81138.1 large conductance mechanosensitive channel protein MscL [Alicyclobacillus sp. SO9]